MELSSACAGCLWTRVALASCLDATYDIHQKHKRQDQQSPELLQTVWICQILAGDALTLDWRIQKMFCFLLQSRIFSSIIEGLPDTLKKLFLHPVPNFFHVIFSHREAFLFHAEVAKHMAEPARLQVTVCSLWASLF